MYSGHGHSFVSGVATAWRPARSDAHFWAAWSELLEWSATVYIRDGTGQNVSITINADHLAVRY